MVLNGFLRHSGTPRQTPEPMRTTSSWLILILELSWCLGCLSIQAPEPVESPHTPPVLPDKRTFCPLFFPTAHPNSLLSISSSSIPGASASSPSSFQHACVTQTSATDTIEQAATTSFAEPPSGPPDESSNSSWTPPKIFTDLSAFNVTHFASGRGNLEVVAGITPSAGDVVLADESSSWTLWRNASSMLQLFYPKNSINPARSPKGGSEFYASPLDVSGANNVTFEYSVFFPSDFEWVKGGKLPGLYGGRTRCSGGDPALDCFSTRLMWRAGGAGELYLYAPKDRQTPELCSTPPLSLCETTYGLSIGRGSFRFTQGGWTNVSQTVVLNSPGVQNGGFVLAVNGETVIDRTDVFYRDKPRELDSVPLPSCDSNSQGDDGHGLLGPLLGGLVGSGPDTQADSPVQQKPVGGNAERCLNAGSLAGATQETDDPIGFQGVFFSTFFGGHHKTFATPKDQFVWFKDFALYINDP
ncbi:hypothetical protein BC826DRAFT_1087760 [Russula brevipes]|nr:hypothetical protein BC826DRAFT_1087760 [Russula brevipes]